MQNKYTEDYYLRGVEKGLSNYQDFRWLESRTMDFAKSLIDAMNIKPGDDLLDWGAARGFCVKALRRLGVDAWGYDISEWAVANCDPEVKDYVHTSIRHDYYDHVILKDLCEHLDMPTLIRTAEWLAKNVLKSVLIIVPLTSVVGGNYVRQEDDMDVTHQVRWPLDHWMDFFNRRIDGRLTALQGSWHIHGLKPTSLSHPKSCGFITLRRI